MSDPGLFLVVNGPEGNRTIALDEGSAWTMGRAMQHPIVLADDSVSRDHALIQCAHPGEFYLIDLGSRNGSYVNGVRVSVPRPLCDGDNITIGESTVTFHSSAPAPSLTQAAQTKEFDQTRANFSARLLTVLVVDIRDFTGLAQQLEQKVLCEAIGAWFRLGGKIVQEHGSWTQKYIGDAIMSVWLHVPDQKKPELLPVLQAYVELADITADIGRRFDLPYPLRIGAGINTGVALVGNTGCATVSDFTAIGDSVNAAFRIESAAKQLGADLVIGEKTYDHLDTGRRPEPCFARHEVMLKGYDQPATVWAAELESVRNFALEAAAAGPSNRQINPRTIMPNPAAE